jgi:hypothetical protein
MVHHIFCQLLRELEARTWLCPTRYVSSKEQLAIFFRIACTGQGNIEMQERFQLSGDTISKWVFSFIQYSNLSQLIVDVFTAYSTCLSRKSFMVPKYVCLPRNEVPPEILNNPNFFPYFSGCRGALDGSLLHAFVSKFVCVIRE